MSDAPEVSRSPKETVDAALALVGPSMAGMLAALVLSAAGIIAFVRGVRDAIAFFKPRAAERPTSPQHSQAAAPPPALGADPLYEPPSARASAAAQPPTPNP